MTLLVNSCSFSGWSYAAQGPSGYPLGYIFIALRLPHLLSEIVRSKPGLQMAGFNSNLFN